MDSDLAQPRASSGDGVVASLDAILEDSEVWPSQAASTPGSARTPTEVRRKAAAKPLGVRAQHRRSWDAKETPSVVLADSAARRREPRQASHPESTSVTGQLHDLYKEQSVRRRKRVGEEQQTHRASRGLAMLACLALSTPRVVCWLECALDGGTVHGTAPMEGEPVVAVLGYRLSKDGTPSPLLKQRIDAAVSLAAHHRASLLFSGGVPRAHPAVDEAAAMASYARSVWPRSMRRVRRVLLERASRTTRENALLSMALLRGRWPRKQLSLLVVTNAFHSRRACAAFRRAAESAESSRHQPLSDVRCVQMQPSLEPSPPWTSQLLTTPSTFEVALLVMRELPALLKYWACGWMLPSQSAPL